MRRLHIQLTLGFPTVVDVELNDVLATPDGFWKSFVNSCAYDNDQVLFLAQVGESCVGMGHVRRHGERARLGMLYVDGRQRRQGIRKALVAAQEDWARAEGATELVCHIPEVSAGQQLAEELGWERTREMTS